MKSLDSAGVKTTPREMYLNSFPVTHGFRFWEDELMYKVLCIKTEQFLGDGYSERFERELSWFMCFLAYASMM